MGRIIPARAGFTRPWCTGQCGRRDHPRSRGVYPRSNDSFASSQGSSPLARGLLIRGIRSGSSARIIPARAGFTPTIRTRTGPGADHPRSRGVYPATRDARHSYPGSSPLARGLLTDGDPVVVLLRIIPARAGFTDVFLPGGRGEVGSSPLARGLRGRDLYPPTGWKDHPRSRGVYSLLIYWTVKPLGSSPLARGLREPGGIDHELWRIIPARAGFTWP